MIRAFALLVLIWALGFALFVVTLPGPAADTIQTDAIVVPTGGQGRISRGLALLAAHKAQRMLITGADRRVKPEKLAAMNGAPVALFKCCVDIGTEAVDTRSNADETIGWINAHHYRSVRLVTTDWHMPRARFELRRVAGNGLTIISDAVDANADLPVLLREYHKFLVRRIAALAGF